MLAMISEEPSVKVILDNLLGGTGTQLAVAPAEDYIAPDQDASFFELARECCLMRHEVLCGYVFPSIRASRRRVGFACCVLTRARACSGRAHAARVRHQPARQDGAPQVA